MRNVTFAFVVLVAGVAGAQGSKSKSAAAETAAKAAIDKADEAFNAHDAKALAAMLDKSYFGASPTMSGRYDSPEAMSAALEPMITQGGRMTRGALTVKTDDDGDTAWYVADYTFIPKVGPGMLPMHRRMRESGVLVKRGKEWKFAMTHMSVLWPDERAQMAPPATPTPAKR